MLSRTGAHISESSVNLIQWRSCQHWCLDILQFGRVRFCFGNFIRWVCACCQFGFRWFDHSVVSPFVRASVRLFVRSRVASFVRLLARSLFRSFVRSC
jgi:hypothetical protein